MQHAATEVTQRLRALSLFLFLLIESLAAPLLIDKQTPQRSYTFFCEVRLRPQGGNTRGAPGNDGGKFMAAQPQWKQCGYLVVAQWQEGNFVGSQLLGNNG